MPSEMALALGAVFVAVALGVGGVVSLALTRLTVARRRLDGLAGPASTGIIAREVRLDDGNEAVLQRFSRFVPRSPKDMGRLRKRLARAGKHGAGPVVLYSLAELLLPLLFGGLMLAAVGTSRQGIFFALLAAIVGYMLPGLVLQRLITLRKKQVQNGLPDALDLLIVCVEAGSSLDQAVVKASEELHISYPALAEELRHVNTEVRAGKPRLEAFKNFAERTKVDDVRALVAMMVQTDRFGTSIAQALRTFAEAMRTKRRQNAEERANKLGVKLVFPLVFFLFPALYVVMLGPGAIKIFRVLIQNFGRP